MLVGLLHSMIGQATQMTDSSSGDESYQSSDAGNPASFGAGTSSIAGSRVASIDIASNNDSEDGAYRFLACADVAAPRHAWCRTQVLLLALSLVNTGWFRPTATQHRPSLSTGIQLQSSSSLDRAWSYGSVCPSSTDCSQLHQYIAESQRGNVTASLGRPSFRARLPICHSSESRRRNWTTRYGTSAVDAHLYLANHISRPTAGSELTSCGH